jgi:hypothetical protein
MPIANQGDPHLRLQHIRIRLCDVIAHLRADVGELDEPQLRAIFATSAEVLSGLVTALDHYEQARHEQVSESAWHAEPRRRRSG